MWKRAFRDTKNYYGWDTKIVISTVIPFLLGLIIYRLWQGEEAVKSALVEWFAFALAPVGLFTIGLFLFNLIRAPVFIRFEKEKEPRLAIEGVVRCHYGQGGHSWGLVIKNLGTDRADDCRGTLIDIDFASPTEDFSMEWWPKNEQLQWAEMLPGMVREFSIPGLERRNLHVIINEITELQTKSKATAPLYIAYARDELSRERSPLTSAPCFRPTSVIDVDSTESILIISVISKNRAPIYAVCYIHEDHQEFHTDYKLEILEKNIKSISSIVEYRRNVKTIRLRDRNKRHKV